MERVINVGHCHEVVVRRQPRWFTVVWARARAAGPWVVMLLAMVALVALADWSRSRMEAGVPPAWSVHIHRMDEALARGDIRAAIRPWNEAYRAALTSVEWEGMAIVGDAYLRLTERVEYGGPARAARPIVARRIFEGVLARASQQASREGVLRAAQGFAAIGDQDMADQCREVASRLAPAEGTR